MTTYVKIIIAAIAVMCFCTISIPLQASWLSPLRSLFSIIPFVASNDAVGSVSLTQIRYSLLSVVLVIVAAIILLNIIISQLQHRRLTASWAVALLIIFSCIAAVSAIYFHNFSDLAKLFVYCEIAISICWMSDDERNSLASALLTLLIVIGVVNALVTIAQFLVLAQGQGGIRALRTARPDGIFGDSIISGLICVMALVPIYRRSGFSFLVKALLIAIMFIAGILTGSRSFYVLAAIACGLIVLFFAKGGGIKAILIFAVCVVALSSVSFMVDRISAFDNSVSSIEQNELSGRELKASLAIELFDEHPIFGIGTGRYAFEEKQHFDITMSRYGVNGTNPHNIYLQMLCENGIVGFIPFLGFFIYCLYSLWRRRSLQALLILILYMVIGATLGIWYSAAVTSLMIAMVFAYLPFKHTAPFRAFGISK